MDPIRLYMKDFCSHSETEFDFDFQSALIIGKIKGNERFSNASGKSTVFTAILYVLYNEIQFSTLDKIIRNGCDSCTVEMDFLSSLDNCIYRSRRSTSHKSGTDLRLYRKDGDVWTDLTQRRATDTEKELAKIVGFNYRVFCASSLFVQPGAENNTQKEFGNLPALTVEKRKAVLREILQLNVYNNYEKIAKKKTEQINSEINKNNILLSSLGDPQKDINAIEKELIGLSSSLEILNTKKDETKKSLEAYHLEFAEINAEMATAKSQKEIFVAKEKDLAVAITKYTNLLNRLKLEMKNLPGEGKALTAKLEEDKKSFEQLKGTLQDSSKLNEERKTLQQAIATENAEIQMIDREIIELQKPLPNGPNCSLCHQNLSEDHRHSWDTSIKKKIAGLVDRKVEINKKLSDKIKEEKNLSILIRDNDSKIKLSSQLENNISLLEKDLSFKRIEFKKMGESYEENKSILSDKLKENDDLKLELSKLNLSALEAKELKLKELNGNILVTKKYKEQFSDEIAQLNAKQAVHYHKIEQLKDNLLKIAEFNGRFSALQSSLNVHQKVVEAFSSGGIPSLIIQSVLDDFQDEANKWLLQLHPGIQLQFVITKDNSKKQQEDTLDILYFIGGAEMEYRQLSGAQKMLVSIAIKLAIMYIMNRKLGISMKLMLLDEVDQPLDPGTAEIFADAIKVLHKDIKILAITHNPDLKHKFSHAVIVDQDENNISTGKLVNF